MKSTHKCEVVPVALLPHENADTLSLVKIDGYIVGVKTADWIGIEKGIYIPPESVVDVTRPEFTFLAPLSKDGKTARVKVKKFRGIQSFGLLIPAPNDAVIGEDYAERLGVTHYEPEFEICMGGDNERPPVELANVTKYDIDTARKYAKLFVPGEMVFVTSKLHEANATYSWVDGRIWVKSRSFWKKESEICPWWMTYYNTPSIKKFCEENPGWRLHGEMLGCQGKDYEYGYSKNKPGFAAFDISKPDGTFVGPQEFFLTCHEYSIPTVNLMYVGPWIGLDEIAKMASGKYTYNGYEHTLEGVVICPQEERWDCEVGRVKLKIVSFDYLNKD
jgi:RNA ligase (TIGR02306 family)